MKNPTEPTLDTLAASRGLTNCYKHIMMNHWYNSSKLIKNPGTSATGTITKVERRRRNRLKKIAKVSKKTNRK